ncbi:MAG: hypothetical protein GX593_05720, partial [Actinomycetales bacterium]|nr:hypothetical protein [Actinomycetales bacterium]
DGGLLVGAVGSARWGRVLDGRVGVFLHDDDPVTQLSLVPRPRVLLALRGAACVPVGTGHRYGPELEEAWRENLGHSRVGAAPVAA